MGAVTWAIVNTGRRAPTTPLMFTTCRQGQLSHTIVFFSSLAISPCASAMNVPIHLYGVSDLISVPVNTHFESKFVTRIDTVIINSDYCVRKELVNMDWIRGMQLLYIL